MNTQTKTSIAESRLTCERCHAIGYEVMAAEKISYLAAPPLVVNLETNRVSTKWGELGFAVVQGIKQQTGLKLVSNFGIGKTVNETLDAHFFRGKSNRRHDGPPKRRNGSESLAVLSACSSNLRHQIQPCEAAANSRLLVNASARFFFRCISRGRRAFKATRFARLSQPFVHGERPCPLAVFHSRKDVDDAAFVFESFHDFLVGISMNLDSQYTETLSDAPLMCVRQSSHTAQGPSEFVSNYQDDLRLSQPESLFNKLHRKENCSAFRNLVRALDGGFTRVLNPFAAAANHVASAPATVANRDWERRNCMATESNDLQHLSLCG